jgi:hypothetical protein
MGAVPWYYFVPYQPDLNKALEELKLRVFQSGEYNPVTPFPFRRLADPPVLDKSKWPQTIEAARIAAEADGTRSILDMDTVAERKHYGVVVPLTPAEMLELYSTERPTKGMIEDGLQAFSDVGRGHGICVIVFEADTPSEILFFGYSYD